MMTDKIRLVDLQRQYQTIAEELHEAIERVIASGRFIKGEENRAFEQEFARFCTCRFAVALSNGTVALFVALKVLGIGEGDEVIVPVNGFIACPEAVSLCGARPVFVDNESEGHNLDPSQLSKLITPRTRAVMVIHLCGQPARMEEILEVARAHRLYVIEDCAQAHGAQYKGKRVGSLGDIGCFSFFPAKNLGAFGDAGALVTNNPEWAEQARLFIDHGRREKYQHEQIGFNFRLAELQAAVLRVNLRHLQQWNERRRQLARLYQDLLAKLPLRLPVSPPHTEPVYHLYVVRTEKRDPLREFLHHHQVETGIHYPIPLHLQPAYQFLGHKEGDFPCAEQAAREILSLPIHSQLRDEEVERIVELVHQFFSQ